MIKDIKGGEWRMVGMVSENVALVTKVNGRAKMVARVENGVIVDTPTYVKGL